MSVAGEVEVAIRTESREHLIARCVDGLPQILYHAYLMIAQEPTAPDVVATDSSRHVADEVEPFAVGTDSGVGETGEGIF